MKKQLQTIGFIFILSLLGQNFAFAQAQADSLAPEIVSGPKIEDITGSSVTISLETDEPSAATIHYGKGHNLAHTVSSDMLAEEHEILISDLNASTLYFYTVSVTDSIGNGPFTTEIDSFRTEEAETDDEEEEYPLLSIEPDEADLVVGDTLELSVLYWPSDSVAIDTSAAWSVHPDSLASIDSNGVLIAGAPGECVVEAVLDTLSAWISVKIDPEGEDPEGNENHHLVVMPRDTVVTVGAQISYEVYNAAGGDSLGAQIESGITWSLEGMPVGSISGEGLFTASDRGFAVVTAEYEDRKGTATVIVSDSTSDSTLNQITITRSSPNPNGYSVMRRLNEGEIWRMGGLPYPMNILNGGTVYFPIGSLVEDVRIHIDLPGFAVHGPEGVNFGPNGVVGGVDFKVMVNDSVVEPYYFETPLIVGIVYKRGLLLDLGIDPLTLSLYFVNVEGDSVVFDTTGIGSPTLDLTHNRIVSSVAHFSSLAVKGTTASLANDDRDPSLPLEFRLHQNYPNPFNPTTTISYEIRLRNHVNIAIYDILGNQVRTLVNQDQNPGYREIIWDSKDHYGKNVSAGIYIYQMTVGKHRQTKKMVLVK